MDASAISSLISRALTVATVVSAPVLIICLAVGIVISIFQAATQIHEQSLTFVPKIVAVVLFLLVAGNWMVSQIVDFTKEAFAQIANL